MNEDTDTLMLADYEELERQYRAMCDIATHIALELPADKIEYLFSIELPFHYNAALIAGLASTMNDKVVAELAEGPEDAG